MPYRTLSSFYFFYFASLGALIPYWAVYLESLGFSPRQIGELMAILMATKMVSPNIWGWIADHTGQGMRMVRLGSLLSVATFLAVFFGHGYLWIALVMLLFSFFWNAVLPQFEAVTLAYLGGEQDRYSSIRLWGSVGFIVAVAGLGPLLDHFGTDPLPWVISGLLLTICLAAWQVPQCRVAIREQAGSSLWEILFRPQVFVLLLCCFLMQASHGPYYTFFSLYLEQYGYSRSQTGVLWGLGVLAEVGVFLIMHRLVPRFGLHRLLFASLLLAAFRWLFIGFWAENPYIMLFSQLLHAASFGVFHASAIALVHRYFAQGHQGKGQALYSSISFGAGGAAGSLYSGYLWEQLQPSSSFYVAALFALSGALLAGLFLRGFGGKIKRIDGDFPLGVSKSRTDSPGKE